METEKNTMQIRSVLTAEVKFIIGVVVFVVGGLGPYYTMREDIALIQKDISIINTNHLSHTQDLAQEVKEIAQHLDDQQKQIIELQKQLIVISGRK